MTADELGGEMKAESEDLRGEMRTGFQSVWDQFKALRTEMQTEFTAVRAEIKAEGETTRRHFDIMVEKVNESVKIVAEVNAHQAVVLDSHDKRITRLESRG